MLLIVAHHYVVNSGLLGVMANEPLSAKSLYLYLLGMWGKTGINCFVLITGYFMCRSHITLRKFLKLLLEVMFYNIVIWAIFVATGYETFSLRLMFKELLPITSVASDFTSSFLLFYLLIPFLNVLVSHLDRKMHCRLVLLCLFTYTVMGSIPKIHVAIEYVTWFSVLFVISSYIRFYGLLPRLRNSQWGWLTLLSIILSMVSVVCIIATHLHFGMQLESYDPYGLVSDSNALMAVVVAVCSFMYFKDLPIKQSKVINTVSASTFGVLCIHASSDTMRQWLWKDVADCVSQYTSGCLVIMSLATVLAVFAVCIAIDYIRIHTIEKWTFRFMDKRIGISKIGNN